MIKHIVFDFDDTLSMTEELGFDLENSVASDMGFAPMTRAIHKSTWGKPLKEIIPTRIPGIDPEEFMRRVGLKMKELSKEGKFDVVSQEKLNALQKMLDAGNSLYILTSRLDQETIHLRNGSHALSKFIKEENFYFKEKTSYNKPNPLVFEQFLTNTRALPKECLYVGDSPTDAVAAKLSGIYFIASLESQLRKRSDFPINFVDTFISDVKDLSNVEIISKLDFKIPNDEDLYSVLKTHSVSVPHYYFSK